MDALTPYNPPRLIAGLDIGQMQDHTALAIVERDMHLSEGRLVSKFFCGHLERLPLQTSYPVVVEMVRQRLERIGERCALVIDATGVGRGIVDLFREAWTVYDDHTMQRVVLPGKPSIIEVTFTHMSGLAYHGEFRAERWDILHVPMLTLIMGLVRVLQQGRIKVAEGMDELGELLKEAQAWEWKPKTTRDDDPYMGWKTGKHDDLLIAFALAVWWGAQFAMRTVPNQGTQYASGTRNPLLNRGHRPLAGGTIGRY